MSLISPERQYAINYEISREAPTAPQAKPAAAKKSGAQPEQSQKILRDDPVTLRQSFAVDAAKPSLSLQDFRQSVGQDAAFLEATLRNKLAEYGLRPNTKVELTRDAVGNVQVSANAPQALLSQINQDLNHNQEVRAAFKRLSLNQPTLDYAANVNKLSSAYGAGNSLFNSLVSARDDNNSLMDIANRYEKLKQSISVSPATTLPAAMAESSYRFRLNG